MMEPITDLPLEDAPYAYSRGPSRVPSRPNSTDLHVRLTRSDATSSVSVPAGPSSQTPPVLAGSPPQTSPLLAGPHSQTLPRIVPNASPFSI